MNWKDAWEDQAQEQLQAYLQMDEDLLLKLVANGDWDMFYTIRSALKKKGTQKAIPVLIEILRKLDDKELYLERHHICETLFLIMKIKNEDLFWDIVGNLKGVNVKKKNIALGKLENKA